MQRPPDGVRLVVEAVCIIKGVKPKRVPGEKASIVLSSSIIVDWGGSMPATWSAGGFADNLKTFYLGTLIPLFCFSFFLWSLRFLFRPVLTHLCLVSPKMGHLL